MSDEADVMVLRVSGKWVDQGTIDRANETVLAADALAKAAKEMRTYYHAQHCVVHSDRHLKLCLGVKDALAAYEKVRGK